MRIDGACHCGRITFQAEIDPKRVRICHCTDCQTLSGSPFRVVVPAPEADFVILSGAPKIYVKTAESGRKRQQAFCADCGTPLYATSVEDGPRTIGIRLGAVNQRRQLAPRRQYWCRSALEWLPELDSIEKFAEQ